MYVGQIDAARTSGGPGRSSSQAWTCQACGSASRSRATRSQSAVAAPSRAWTIHGTQFSGPVQGPASGNANESAQETACRIVVTRGSPWQRPSAAWARLAQRASQPPPGSRRSVRCARGGLGAGRLRRLQRSPATAAAVRPTPVEISAIASSCRVRVTG